MAVSKEIDKHPQNNTSLQAETAKPSQETHVSGPHISIKAEEVFKVGTFPVTNSLILSIIVLVLFTILAVKYTLDLKNKNKTTFFYFLTFSIRSLHKFFESALGDKINMFFPLVGAFFFFIFLNNEAGLLPGVGSLLIKTGHGSVPLLRATTADLNTTIALAIIIMVYIQYVGIKHLGIKGYGGKFINFANPIAFFVGILEIVSEISRVLSFAFRLFGNIFAGEVLIAVIAFLIPVLASLPFLVLELFVGFIQAVVFAMLSSVLLRLAVTKHH